MQHKIETIKVECKESDCGYKIINKCDMCKDDKEFGKDKPKQKKQKKDKKKD